MPILEVISLHGPPRLGGVLFPYAEFRTPVEGEPLDESRYKELEDGTTKLVGSERYRVRWTLGWKCLDLATYEALFAIIKLKAGFAFEPRTIRAGVDDPEAVVPSYLVRLTSGVPLTARLDQDNEFDVTLELVTVGILTAA